MANKQYAFDDRLKHREVASAAVTATATVATIDQRVAMRTDYVTLIGIEAIDIADNDELYTFVIEVSNDDFSTVEVAEIRDFGATEVRQSGAPDSAAGDRIEMQWSTEVNGVAYKDWRLRVVISGTSPSITYHAHSSVC